MRWLAVALFAVPALSGCVGEDAPAATIRWTDHGIPHITASDWHGLGLGYGYAFARDNLCFLMEEVVTVSGERSKYWGPDESYTLTSNGQTFTNLESDLFWALHNSDADLVDPAGEADMPELRDVVAGYAEGVNRYLGGLPDEPGRHADCRDGEWLRPLTAEDVIRRFTKLQLLASSLFFAPGMVKAAPPPAGLLPEAATRPTTPERWSAIIEPSRLPTTDNLHMGSNAYALGGDMTPNGAGMLLGNPHFSWHGPERFHELHLTIPGLMDTMGMTIHGVPIVLIGFNDHVAWSHTVSTGWRFTLHELTLVPGLPTSYIVDGEVHEMQTKTVTVDTTSGPVEHTFYLTQYGPVIEFPLAALAAGVEVGLDWLPTTAYAIQDANARNDRLAEQFLRFNTASSFDDFIDSLDEVHGVPWVNTIAAGPEGQAFYGDISIVPHITDDQLSVCNTVIGRATTLLAGLPILDGSRSACDWTEDPAAAQPGIIPAADMPRATRADYVINANDSYWLPNPREPLEGYSPMIGAEQSERSGRTRMGYTLLEERMAGAGDCSIDHDVDCSKMTLARLQQTLFSGRLYFAENGLDEVLAQTCLLPVAVSSSGAVVDLGPPCDVLSQWDRHAGVESRGVALFERFWIKVDPLWSQPFDAADPVATPSGLVAADPRVAMALADAVEELEGAGIALDASVAEARTVDRNGQAIPIHGGAHALGSPSYVAWDWTDGEGFGDVLHGNSYIQTVTWDDGRVQAEAVLSYSQSTDPASPHHADQTWAYSRGEWPVLPFHEEDVAAATVETLELRR